MYEEQLSELFSEVAKQNGKGSYLIPNTKEVKELLKVKPKTLEELSSIKGFPINGKRVEAYGKKLINIFNGKINVSGIKPNNVF